MTNIKYVGKCLLIKQNNERVLVVGDLHLGYEGAMRASGIMIPVRLYEKCLSDFEEIMSSVDGLIDTIVILGDVKHEFGFILQDEWKMIMRFIENVQKKCKMLVIIEGNHDMILFPILNKLGVVGRDYYVWNEFVFMHGDKSFDRIYDKSIKYWIMGHGHPAITIQEGVKREKYKCFLAGSYRNKGMRKVIIVPSFFPLVEGTDPRYFEMKFAWNFNLKNFEVYVVSENLKVLDFGRLNRIK